MFIVTHMVCVGCRLSAAPEAVAAGPGAVDPDQNHRAALGSGRPQLRQVGSASIGLFILDIQ